MTNPIRRGDVVSAIANGHFEIDAAVRQQLAAYIKDSNAYGQHVEASQGIVFDLNMGHVSIKLGHQFRGFGKLTATFSVDPDDIESVYLGLEIYDPMDMTVAVYESFLPLAISDLESGDISEFTEGLSASAKGWVDFQADNSWVTPEVRA